MAIKETATGNDAVAVAGTASAGERTIGVQGAGDSIGVHGEGKNWHGVEGISQSTVGGFGVFGVNSSGGTGVCGLSDGWIGVYGESKSTTGGAGVWGAHKAGGIGVAGIGDAAGVGVYGEGGRAAGLFKGDVEVTGDIRLTNADCAEDFDVSDAGLIAPGTVMVLGDADTLTPCQHSYDKRVAGVLSGAGDYRPGIVLDRQPGQGSRSPVALLGKVFCQVDAGYGPVAVGDLLTTSDTPGHAMKATDSVRAFGAVIGKALRPLEEGQGLIPILIALQ